MALGESIFDVTYLIFILFLGFRLVLEKDKNAKLFGTMAILLGLGDGFHLIPRVMGHLSPDGFEGFYSQLSWGKFITGITMTIFYLLFYFYYRSVSGDGDKNKKISIIVLSIVRILLILLPQNNWGSIEENYTMAIVRNIPFLIMGILLIIWTYKERDKAGLEKMSLLILLSFAFYIPVVLWANKFPMIGLLMMPKTVVYVLIVVFGFKHFVKDFTRRNLLNSSLSYLILGLSLGVFYREFTKAFNFYEENHLSKLHPHTLVLGFILTITLYLLVKDIESKIKVLKKTFKIYNFGLLLTISAMALYGIYDVVGIEKEAFMVSSLSGISGLGHIFLGTSLVMLFLKARSLVEKN